MMFTHQGLKMIGLKYISYSWLYILRCIVCVSTIIYYAWEAGGFKMIKQKYEESLDGNYLCKYLIHALHTFI